MFALPIDRILDEVLVADAGTRTPKAEVWAAVEDWAAREAVTIRPKEFWQALDLLNHPVYAGPGGKVVVMGLKVRA